ncbi:MAG: alpha-mannosidase, partial [Cyanobacteria bacterium J06559_3]
MSTADFSTAAPTVLSTSIAAAATRLRALTQRSQQSGWRHSIEADPAHVPDPANWQHWSIASLNHKGHLAWPKGRQSLWLCQQITVPDALEAFPLTGLSLRLGLTWWADAAKIYVNGNCVQKGDLFDCFGRILLSDRVTPGDTFTVALHLVSPGHDDGALVRSEVIYEAPPAEFPEPGFIADELTVLKTYAAELAPEKLKIIAAAIASLDWSKVANRESFQSELTALRQRLLPLSDWIKQRHIACVGHAHLDLAWLWPVEDTWRAAERTFQSVLSLQESFPELTYTHSSPALFDWLETHRPTLFRQIQQAVQTETWSIDAGLWVEPELNVIGGESLARQILYGQRYVRSRFGQVSAIAWLPDSFGFSWQLPQLLSQGGIRCFATQKLRWNDTTTFPHSLFWWEGLDGTRMLSLTLPPIGSDIAPEQMATHGADWEANTGLPEMLWLPGMGDHGGGPTRDMLEKARRWADSPFFPKLRFTSVEEYVGVREQGKAAAGGAGEAEPEVRSQKSEARSQNTAFRIPNSEFRIPSPTTLPPFLPSSLPLPTWKDELYLELHRGCYTTHADQKWFNRRCEQALVEAEVFASLAQIQGIFDYPKADLETAWKQVLFNQFHDILPGTAIPEVFETANEAWQSAYRTAAKVRTAALGAIAHHTRRPIAPHTAAMPLLIFNSLNWERTELVAVSLTDLPTAAQHWRVLDPVTEVWLPTQLSRYADGSEHPPCQPSETAAENDTAYLLFLATVPSVGYRLYWLVPEVEPEASADPVFPEADWRLENDFLQAMIDPQTGDLTELWEKTTGVNVVRSPANQLQAFKDAGQYWDAWDIAPDYADHPLPPAQLKSITWLERGPLRQRLRVVRTIGLSTFQQDYVLDQQLPYLKVSTVADWQASQVVLKAAFPLSIESDHATFEIPFGAIARPTQSTDPHQQAKWEVPALRWADLSNEHVGLSILTDYKHGFDTQPQQLRLTLLKAPVWPDPVADRGQHAFTYALYPHTEDWREGRTPHWAIAFNTPLRWAGVTSPSTRNIASLPGEALCEGSFVSLGKDTVHLAALKPAEEDADTYVLRCWD